MSAITTIVIADPASADFIAMLDALWREIQQRYQFETPNPMQPATYQVAGAACWLAMEQDQPVGSIALLPLSGTTAELDAMYVISAHRGTGTAQQLMETMEDYARKNGFAILQLRAGAPQPEALRFYEKAGFTPIPAFGKWASDPTALCFEKKLHT